jgi:acyl carrier protein
MDINQQVERLVKESQLFVEMKYEPGKDEVLHWDSMSLIWLITCLEETFKIELDYRTIDLEHFRTINSIRSLIENEYKGAPL